MDNRTPFDILQDQRNRLQEENKRLREALTYIYEQLKLHAIEGYYSQADKIYKEALWGK